MKSLPQRPRPQTNGAWMAMNEVWGTPEPLAQRVWAAIRLCALPEAQTMTFHLEQMMDVRRRREKRYTMERCAHIVDGVCAPSKMFKVVEQCVETRLLSRRDASAFEEYLLADMTRQGAWKSTQAEERQHV